MTHTIEKANATLKEAVKHLKKDWRLGYHIAAPANWINDPNGMVYFNGEYHVFYQHYPHGVDWGPMHWGHVKSKDLVHWEHLPVALAPDQEYDKDGCFSGSAIVVGDTLYLLYTGHVWVDQKSDIAIQTQCLAYSKDGIHFEKYAHNPVIPVAQIPEDSTGHFRDPKMWEKDGLFHVVIGNRTKDDIGRVLHYSSSDLKHWTYEGVIAKNDSNLGYMWECPDLFELDGKGVLCFSPQGMKEDGDKYNNLFQTGYLVGTFDGKELHHGAFHEMDHGHDFYAVQTLHDDKNRRIAIGWMDMWDAEWPCKAHGWCGAMTLPRELHLTQDNKLLMRPVKELETLRAQSLSANAQVIDNQEIKTDINGDLLELNVRFSLKELSAKEFGVKVRCAEDGSQETVIAIDTQMQKLILDRERSGEGVSGIRRTSVDLSKDAIELRIFVDRSSLEVFVNDGQTVMTSRIYPKTTSLGVSLFAKEGKVAVEAIQAWKLKDIGL